MDELIKVFQHLNKLLQLLLGLLIVLIKKIINQFIIKFYRSNNINGKGVFWSNDSADLTHRITSTTELNYTKILNGVLTKSIRIIGWCETDSNFNARFNCTKRSYIYIFPRANINLNVLIIKFFFILKIFNIF